jgi:hypothetical protein
VSRTDKPALASYIERRRAYVRNGANGSGAVCCLRFARRTAAWKRGPLQPVIDKPPRPDKTFATKRLIG